MGRGAPPGKSSLWPSRSQAVFNQPSDHAGCAAHHCLSAARCAERRDAGGAIPLATEVTPAAPLRQRSHLLRAASVVGDGGIEVVDLPREARHLGDHLCQRFGRTGIVPLWARVDQYHSYAVHQASTVVERGAYPSIALARSMP